jgi:hypothetical protein
MLTVYNNLETDISDGTLLTNRFHFAIQDGPLKGKGGLVGWFK